MNSYSSYQNISDGWIDKIPKHWGTIKTKYVSEFRNGFSYKSDEWKEVGIPVIRMSNIGEDGKLKITNKNLKYVSSESYENTKNYLIKKNDILISMTDMNPLMLWLGSTIIFDSDELYLQNQRVGNIRITDQNVNSKFYHYMSNTDIVRNQLKVSVYPNVQTNLSTEPIKNEVFPLPPLPEQTQIVSFLDNKTQKIDKLIEKTEQKIKLLKEKRTSLINHCVTKGLNPNVDMKDSGVEWIGEIPSHWDKTKLSYYCEVKDGTHDTPSYVDDGGIPLVTQKDITKGKLDFSKTKNISYKDYEQINVRSNVMKGDIIMSMIGSIGNPTIVEVDTPFSIKNVCLFKSSESQENIKFIHYLLSSNILDVELNYNSRGGVQGFVSLDVLRNLLYLKPPIDEQTQIVEYLDEQTQRIDSTIEKETQRIELLKEYRQSLISEVVTGKVDVRDYNG
jgi:type I restriction enzyme, S subunit